jgi:hypothetical protein
VGRKLTMVATLFVVPGGLVVLIVLALMIVLARTPWGQRRLAGVRRRVPPRVRARLSRIVALVRRENVFLPQAPLVRLVSNRRSRLTLLGANRSRSSTHSLHAGKPTRPCHPRMLRWCGVDFIRSDGSSLLRDGRPWRFLLVNAYYLADEVGQGHVEHALEALDAAVALGVPVVRTWAFNDAPWKPSRMQDGLGVAHEPGLRALDLVVAEAARRGLRLILPLLDYWPSYGGIAQWLAWRGQPVAPDERMFPERYAARFFGDRQLRDAYRARVRSLGDRINSVSGVRYGDDATVLAWELMNEARQAPDDWIAFAAAVVRDHCRQLVALGDEGARDSPDLDLASLHFYPEKHGAARGDETRFGCAAIVEATRRVTRPLIVGEFGLRDDGLAPVARAHAFRQWLACAADEGVAGMGPWLLGYRARPTAWDEHLTFYAGGEYDALLREAHSSFS